MTAPIKSPTVSKQPAPKVQHATSDVSAYNLFVMNYGEAGVGKSCTAATVSTDCPDLPAAKHTVLHDIFWMCFDSHATDSLRGCNIEVPKEAVFDVPQWVASHKGKRFTSGVNECLKAAQNWLTTHPGGNLVVDTLSSLSGELVVEAGETTPGKPADLGPIDLNQRSWLFAWENHLRFHATIKRMDFGTCVYLVHPKALMDMGLDAQASAQQKSVQKAGKALEGAKIIPAVQGGGINAYQNDCMYILPVQAKRAPKAKIRVRYFITNPENPDKWMVKLKAEGLVGDTEPAHWRKLLAKIKGK